MRTRLLPVMLALLVAAAMPTAAGATFHLEGERIMEHALAPGTDIVFDVPLLVNQEGYLYAKLLPTPGNAVHDGTKANGSVTESTGWRLSFALVRADGERVPLGTHVDSTMTQLVAVAAGERVAFEMTAHVPTDAAKGGPSQSIYLALAYRLDAGGAGGGAASGASMDESRSVRLILSDALLPPALGTPEPEDPTGGPPEIPGVEPITDEPGSPRPSEGPTVVVNAIPTWFLVVLTGFLGVVAVAVGAAAVALVQVARALKAPSSAQVPRSIPVQKEAAAREFLAALEQSRQQPPR